MDELDEAIGKLSAAALQSSPNDDQIIADHVRDSVALLLKARHKLREESEYERICEAECAELRAEIERLRGPVAEDRQRCIDYWGKRAEKAEADKAELLAALRPFAAPTVSDYESQEQRAARAAIAKMEGK